MSDTPPSTSPWRLWRWVFWALVVAACVAYGPFARTRRDEMSRRVAEVTRIRTLRETTADALMRKAAEIGGKSPGILQSALKLVGPIESFNAASNAPDRWRIYEEPKTGTVFAMRFENNRLTGVNTDQPGIPVEPPSGYWFVEGGERWALLLFAVFGVQALAFPRARRALTEAMFAAPLLWAAFAMSRDQRATLYIVGPAVLLTIAASVARTWARRVPAVPVHVDEPAVPEVAAALHVAEDDRKELTEEEQTALDEEKLDEAEWDHPPEPPDDTSQKSGDQ